MKFLVGAEVRVNSHLLQHWVIRSCSFKLVVEGPTSDKRVSAERKCVSWELPTTDNTAHMVNERDLWVWLKDRNDSTTSRKE